MIVRLVKPEDVKADFVGELDFLKQNDPRTYENLLYSILYDGNLTNTIEEDGKVIGIMRGILYAPRCMYVALYPTKEIFNYKTSSARTIKNWLYHVADCLKLERIETRSLDNEYLNRWHKWVGFDLEGKSKKWCYGLNYNLWGIVYGD